MLICMRAKFIKALMFHIFGSETVSLYLGWDVNDHADDASWSPSNSLEEIRSLPKELKPKGYYMEDSKLVSFGLNFVNNLSTETLQLKFEAIQNLPKSDQPSNLPDVMFGDEMLKWAREASWTDVEAVLLSLGITPNALTRYDFANKPYILSFASLPPLNEYDERLRLIQAHQKKNGSMYGEKLEIIGWFRRLKFSFPKGLEKAVSEIEFAAIKEATQLTSSHSYQIEKQTLLKLIGGMAVRGYGYDPLAKRTSVTAEIQTDLDLLGISLDQKTILKWLREATSLVSKEELH